MARWYPVLVVLRLKATFASSLLLAAFGAFNAHAAELVTLRNGFTLNCAAREAISPDTVRLHLNADTTDRQNYMDVPLASIAAVEAAADAVPPSDAMASPPHPKASGVTDIAQQSGETHNLNVALLMAVIRTESAGNASAVSRTGARGLMQLMPRTAAQMGVADSFSPEGNVNGGSTYLDQLLTRYHENITLALAAYNAGPAAVDRYRGMPPYRETKLYVARVIREWNRTVAASQTPMPDRAAR